MVEGVLLDFDGTIVETEKIRYRALNKVLKTYQKRVSYADWERYYKNYDTLTIVSKILPDSATPSQIVEQIHTIRKTIEDEEGVEVKKGFFSFYTYLQEKGIQAVICSGGKREHIKHVMQLGGIPSLPLIAKEDYDERKPNPTVYLKGLDLLALSQQQVLVIDDSYTGLQAAFHAQIPSIYMGEKQFSFHNALAPVALVQDFEEIVKKDLLGFKK